MGIETNTPICGGVQGYPTVTYGDPSALEDYAGAREYEELAKFAKENLKPMCSPVSLENCTEEEKTEIAKFDKLSVEELTAAIAEFEAEVDKLQTKYDQLSSDVETKTENLKKEKGLKFLKTVLASKSKVAEGSDEL